MPHKFERLHIKLPRHLDRRVKLTDEQRGQIRELGSSVSGRKLAKMFNVSRATVRYVLDPQVYEACRAYHKSRQTWLHNYDRKKHTETIKRHRAYKKAALENAAP